MPEPTPPLLFDADDIVDTVRQPMLVLSADLRVRRVNRCFCQTFRVTPEESLGRPVYDLGNRQWDIPALRTLLEDVLPHNTAFDDFEVAHEFESVGRKVMLLNARRIYRAGSQVGFILLAVEDVTERRRLEGQRHELETRFTSLVKNIRDHSIFTTDPDGRITSWNVEAERILGHAEAEILGQNFSVIFTTEDIDGGVPERERRLASENGRAEDERWHVRKGGERFWALGIVTPTHDAAGTHTGYSKILRDMTDRKRAGDAVRASEAHKAAVLRASLDAIVTIDGGGRVVEFNPAAESLFGYTLAEAAGTDLAELIVPARMREGHRRGMARYHATGEAPVLNRRVEMPARRKDGSEITVELVVTRLDGDPPLFTGFVRDITTRKEAEAALAERGRLLALGAAVGTALVEADTLADGLQRCAQAMVDHLGGAFARIWTLDPGGVVLELRASAGLYTHLDGPHSRVPVGRFKIGLIAQERQPHLTNAVVGDDRVSNQEWAVREGVVAFAGYPLMVEGRVVGVTAMFARHALSDATLGAMASVANAIALGVEKKQAEGRLRERTAELAAANASLKDADRRKDEFLATLAHELRNPLAPIRNSLQILEMPRVDAATVERSLNMMGRQVEQLVRLVDDLLDVSRVMQGKVELRRERVELATVVARAVETARPVIDAQGHQLSVALPPESLPLEADPVRLVQVVGNLLTNAAKYTERGGRIWITAERDGHEAVLRVRDTGIGIAPDVLPRIFDLFVQVDHAATRSQGGLGIGLTLVKNLVGMHGGTVEARSGGLGQGSEFVVRLPLSAQGREGPAGASGGPPREEPPAGRRVLVVDDNVDAADSLATLLRLGGHEVRVANGGTAALDSASGYRPEVVFLDIGMPGMDGHEVARRLRGDPKLRGVVLVALTGWGQEEDRRRSADAGFDHHLVKPVEPKALEGVLADPRLPKRSGDG